MQLTQKHELYSAAVLKAFQPQDPSGVRSLEVVVGKPCFYKIWRFACAKRWISQLANRQVDKAGEEQGELVLTALVRSGRLVVGQLGGQVFFTWERDLGYQFIRKLCPNWTNVHLISTNGRVELSHFKVQKFSRKSMKRRMQRPCFFCGRALWSMYIWDNRACGWKVFSRFPVLLQRCSCISK